MWVGHRAKSKGVVTIEVSDLDTTRERMKAALRGEAQGCFITSPTHEDLWATLTANRWAILKAMTGGGPQGMRELARRVGHDVKGVHADAQALVACGVIHKDGGRQAPASLRRGTPGAQAQGGMNPQGPSQPTAHPRTMADTWWGTLLTAPRTADARAARREPPHESRAHR